jgi:hypothetical protein
MLAQTMIKHRSSCQTAVHIARSTPSENFCTLGTTIDNHAPASCLVCELPMTLVRIRPKIASFSEVDTFRCFACGDVQTMELRSRD